MAHRSTQPVTSLISKSSIPATGRSRIPGAGIDLAKTLECGQVFHWTRCEAGFIGTIGETPSYLEQVDGDLIVPQGQETLVHHYLALDHSINVIEASFPKDPTIRAAIRFSRGIRIIRQPIWECLATFLTSAMKQVSHGFRARNLLATAQMVTANEIQLAELSYLPTAEARRTLCRFPGVGDKIANCVLLFAYERMDAVPIDVWIGRALRQTYFPFEAQNVRASRLSEFCNYFGPYAGYAQQYLFHHWRMTYRKTR